MKFHIVYAHHEPGSFTATLKNVTASVLIGAGHQVTETDLYGLGWQPTAGKIDFTTSSSGTTNYQTEQKKSVLNNWSLSPDITGEFARLKEADNVIFHFPVWWSGVPAILKGWFDRVLVMGAAWDEHGQVYDKGLLRGKQALVVTTTGELQSAYSNEGIFKASLNDMLRPVLHGTLAFCGLDVLQPHVIYGVNLLDDAQRAAAIESYQAFIATAFEGPVFYSRFEDAAPPQATEQ